MDRPQEEKNRAKSEKKHAFPAWEELYRQSEVESLPWYNPELDEDLKTSLGELGLRGGRALDLGTGPGTQAMHLARRGFTVTATDISGSAIRAAQKKALEEHLTITWKEDDILDTRLDEPFDLILDRGCFHVLPPERRPDYVRTVSGLLQAGGTLFLKCFSNLEPGEQGPYRFSRAEIEEIFGAQLIVLSIKDVVSFGKPQHHALFCIMKKPDS